MVCLSHLSKAGGRALSHRRLAVSLPDMLQVGVSLPVPITSLELWPSAPEGESSRTTQRIVCNGVTMISDERTIIYTGYHPCHIPSRWRRRAQQSCKAFV